MNKKKGISLIVLIITIVIILILATAILITLSRTNVIENSNEAAVKQDFRALQDELNMYIADRYADAKGDFVREDLEYVDETTTPNINEVLPSLKRTKFKDDVVIVEGRIAFRDSISEREKQWATEAVKDIGKIKKAVVGTLVTGSDNLTITGKDPSTTNPVIPVGFKAVNTAEATWADTDKDGSPDGWNNGLVIADNKDNEFVWVPVDGVNVTYDRWTTKEFSYTQVDYISAYIPSGVSEGTQITKYGGFYVGRYEAGTPDGTYQTKTNSTAIPISKPNVEVWTDISVTNADTSARSMYNNSIVKSGIVTGYAWDTICKWINNEKDGNNNPIHNVDDSTSWGNYSDTTGAAQYDTDGTTKISGSKRATGRSELWKSKNIYDFAGNVNEWSNESYQSLHRVGRGGYCIYSGNNYSASARVLTGSSSFTDSNVGFRVMLYVI